MTELMLAAVLAVVLLTSGWRLFWLATRVDRAHTRAERTWAALDAALVRRAQGAAELALAPRVDPATALLVADAAAAALEPDLCRADREQAESDLSHVLDLVTSELGDGTWGVVDLRDRAVLSRRLHNDAVATARTLHRRRTVRLFRLAGPATEPTPFEMADDRRPSWAAEW
jgi:hypothetical protein